MSTSCVSPIIPPPRALSCPNLFPPHTHAHMHTYTQTHMRRHTHDIRHEHQCGGPPVGFGSFPRPTSAKAPAADACLLALSSDERVARPMYHSRLQSRPTPVLVSHHLSASCSCKLGRDLSTTIIQSLCSLLTALSISFLSLHASVLDSTFSGPVSLSTVLT